jgi:mannan polymerase II complex ANP1 subunit
MERERLARETEEKEKAERAQKMKDAFGDTNGQWEKDKAAMQDMALDDKKAAGKGQQKKTERSEQKEGDTPPVKKEAAKQVRNQQ